MVVAEVIQTADNEHASHQGLGLLGKIASTASQPRQALSESSIEPFDVSRIDHAAILSSIQQSLDHLFATLGNSPFNSKNLFLALLDDLDNGNVGPGDQARFYSFSTLYYRDTKRTNSNDIIE